MIKRLSFGQYKHKDSFIHKLDSRLKLIYVLILSILVFAIDDSLRILVFSSFAILIILVSKLELDYLVEGLKPFYVIFIFIFLMYLIFSRDKLGQGIIAIWRFLMLMILSLALTYTTTISNLISAIEKMLMPLKILNINPRNASTMISMAIRFVPVMFANFEKLRQAMLARLASLRKFKHIKLIMLSLLEKMLKSASTLSDAMQSRLYNENTESQKVLNLERQDYSSMICMLVFVLIIY